MAFFSSLLKPENRRRGIFIITNHRDHFWIDSKTKEKTKFDKLIENLSALAKTITHNTFGEVEVAIVGINAWQPKHKDQAPSKRVRRPKASGQGKDFSPPPRQPYLVGLIDRPIINQRFNNPAFS